MARKSKKPLFPKNSRMRHFDIIFDESVEQNRAAFYRFNVNKRIGKSNNDTIYTIPKGMEYRLDLISVKFYGTSSYDWFIAEYNNIEDPIKDIKAGKKIRIPNKIATGKI